MGLLAGVPRGWRVRLRPVIWLSRLLVVALLVLAAARPQASRAGSTVNSEGIDIALTLDLSGSMTQTRLEGGNALDVAKEVAAKFVRGRGDDRVGLVVFQGESDAISPLTADSEAVSQLIEQLESGLLPEGTAIGLAMGDAVALLRESQARSRIAILLTDGENNKHEIEPLAAARIAEALGIRVYTIGVVSNEQGPASVDEDALEEIARVTGANYYRATSVDTLTSIYADIDQLEKSRLEGDQFDEHDELAPYFLGPAFGILMLEMLLGATAFRKLP